MNVFLHRPAVFVLLVVQSLFAYSGKSAVAFEHDSFDFDRVTRGALVAHEFTLKNSGPEPVRIKQVQLTPPLALASMPAQIAPGAEAKVRVKLYTADLLGDYEGHVLIRFEDPGIPNATLAFTGTVVRSVDVLPYPALFVAAQRGEPKEVSREVVNRESAPVKITGMEQSSTERFIAKLHTLAEGQRYKISLTMKTSAALPAGEREDVITLHTSSAITPTVKIPVHTKLRERVYTFPDAVDMGVLRLSDLKKTPSLIAMTTQQLMVYQYKGKDFQLKAHMDVPGLTLDRQRGFRGDRYQIAVQFDAATLRAGAIKGKILLETNDPQFSRLEIPVSGEVVDK
jgi:hypothetical protein